MMGELGFLPLVITLVGLAIVALGAAAESVVAVTARPTLREILRRDTWRDDTAEAWLQEPTRTWATLLVMDGFGWLLVGAGLLGSFSALGLAGLWLVVALVLGAVLAIALCNVAPRSLALRSPEMTAFVVAWPFRVATLLLAPVARPLASWADRADREGHGDLVGASAIAVVGEDVRALVEAGEDGFIEEDEREMIVGVVELGETKAREVMVPRIDVIAIPDDADLSAALDTIITQGHSRIPVYRESLDEVVGLLYAKDLLKAFRNRDYQPAIGSMLREPYFVPETKPVDELLADLQTRKVHMAIVVDEYGGTAGIVTIEDLIEEIVGEIQDEYDEEESRIELVSDDEGYFHAGVDIDDVNRLMHIDLPTDRADTLAGLVFNSLGKVPEVGEYASFDDADIEVLAVQGSRIRRVRVVRRPAEGDGPADEALAGEQVGG